MQIPQYFVRKASRQFGEEGHAWALRLPSLVDRCRAAWQLIDCVPVHDLSINFVCMCRSAQFGDAVLKIQGPHGERYTEIEALRLLAGTGCCRMLAVDLQSAAMLLERIKPGLPLRALSDRDQQLSIGTRMIASLPQRVPGGHTLPTYQDWLDTAAGMLSRTAAPPALGDLLREACEQYRRLHVPGEPAAVLHGDLHHDNILLAGGDHWVAIDPQGVIGPPVLEAGRFIQNHAVEDYATTDLRDLDATVGYISRTLQYPHDRVLRAFFVLHVLSVCWDWEMHAEPRKLARGAEQCRQVRAGL